MTYEPAHGLASNQADDDAGKYPGPTGHGQGPVPRLRGGHGHGRPLPIHVLSQLMGHASTKVTEIYPQMVGEEQRRLMMEAWES